MSSGLPLLAQLSKGTRAAFPLLESLAGTDLGSSAIVKQARAAGYSFTTQQAYDVIASLRNEASGAQYLRLLDKSTIPNPDLIPTATSRQLRNYSYRLLIHGKNPDTGEQQGRNITISSDTPLSRQQVIDSIPDIIALTIGSDPILPDSVSFVRVTKSAALG